MPELLCLQVSCLALVSYDNSARRVGIFTRLPPLSGFSPATQAATTTATADAVVDAVAIAVCKLTFGAGEARRCKGLDAFYNVNADSSL